MTEQETKRLFEIVDETGAWKYRGLVRYRHPSARPGDSEIWAFASGSGFVTDEQIRRERWIVREMGETAMAEYRRA